MRSVGIFLCMVFISFPVHGTYRHGKNSCQCNGKALYCVMDAGGLRCVKCTGNTEGRHCESCKEGFYHQAAGKSCISCNCSPTGSLGPRCDSEGRCSCKAGFTGEKCDRTPLNLKCRGQTNSQDCLPCFCNGHSSDCSKAAGYSVHNITSSFQKDDEGWHVATAQGVTPPSVHFRWSHTHGDLEAISKDILPIYFYAPSSYLGNQILSYGQTLSFSLRLDRGTRRPSVSDVVLQGAGLQVSASLGDLRTVVACAKKISYTFRLDEKPGSKWQPELSSLQFQKLLSNLTAIMIRGTFGENGRGYLDNVSLVSARKGTGTPADWVEKCSCPTGYEGQFCERCAPGFKRHSSDSSPLGSCVPCACQAGTCDPETGECYSSDDDSLGQSCPTGSYNNPQRPNTCLPCSCPGGSGCSVMSGTLQVKCDRCPLGTSGSRCHVCANGFYGDPLGERGIVRPCQPCQCNGHVDLRLVGSCHSTTGECLRCQNKTSGPSCENCLPGFYHSNPRDACKACACDPMGSFAQDCSDAGQCDCRPGYEGLRCHQSSCPSCFDPLKSKIDNYAGKVREIEALFNEIASGKVPVNDAQMERSVRALEDVVADMQRKADKLSEMERSLEVRLNKVSGTQLGEDRDIQSLAETMDNIKLQEQQYKRQVSAIQQLVQSAKLKLQQAKQELRQAEFPSGDAAVGSDSLTGLVQKATTLAEKHQGRADFIEKTANSALSDAEKALNLMRTAMTGENKVKEQIVNLKALYEKKGSEVKAMQNEASGLITTATGESDIAANTLKQISSLVLPQPPTEDMATLVGSLNSLKKWMEGNLTAYQELQKDVDADQSEAGSLLAQAKAAQQKYDKLLGRADAAKAVADLALKGINDNMSGVEDALETLRGFDDKISENKALAEDAISKLPGINGTIRNAVTTNAQTMSVLDSVDTPYNGALGTISTLGEIVTRLEGMPDVVTLSTELERNAGVLRGDVDGLQDRADDVLNTIKEETKIAEAQKDTVIQVAEDATTALGNAEGTRTAVGETLKTVTDLLNAFGSTSGPVDLNKVNELQAAVNTATTRVAGELLPRLKELEDIDARQKTALSNLSANIDAIMADIENLEDIRARIPNGCFNAPPIERP
ncbi:laminin subunit gamma-2 [Alosa sapidissima]|uniref:laminin subunit gamma-2 n=1 Tax=Alosa sapidissima TaxID=34773 RepID=UPI001C0A033A|nr:laminin subunit gamma-2 [Alosa sapidissima]